MHFSYAQEAYSAVRMIIRSTVSLSLLWICPDFCLLLDTTVGFISPKFTSLWYRHLCSYEVCSHFSACVISVRVRWMTLYNTLNKSWVTIIRCHWRHWFSSKTWSLFLLLMRTSAIFLPKCIQYSSERNVMLFLLMLMQKQADVLRMW